jgi:hypothetical protein
MQRVGFHDVEEAFLAQAIFLFEEVVFGVRARYVATDDLSFFSKEERGRKDTCNIIIIAIHRSIILN